MGLARLVCCGRPQANKATSTCPQPGKDAKDIPGVIRPGAGSASVGGKTLLVTAQSGTAQDFHNYLHNSLELTFVNSPGRIALQPHISETVKQLDNTGAAPAEVENLPRRNADVAASRAYSCPVGEMQRPPSSLLEASLRRRQRARAPVAQRAAEGSEAMDTFRTPRSLQNPDASQLQTIARFMTAYLATLDDMECKFAMTPLLHEAVILRAHDGKHYHGKAAVLRRMQQGIAMLQKMAGKDAAAAKSIRDNFKMSAPVQREDGTWTVAYTLKRGVFKFSITNVFTMEEQKIIRLHVSRS